MVRATAPATARVVRRLGMREGFNSSTSCEGGVPAARVTAGPGGLRIGSAGGAIAPTERPSRRVHAKSCRSSVRPDKAAHKKTSGRTQSLRTVRENACTDAFMTERQRSTT
ncbi:hypothetical protein GCM10010507_03840 [Streptomyces cinnamoneus]|uniref:Uncharacterized protein n=1 Tax=Streptomyces cinnamoneus TaxID=53446 RepID=A0A918T9K1_STRCJ|nr:hypothetical protein GCM10010507_03840 [Streptomyces cinnamoneus]